MRHILLQADSIGELYAAIATANVRYPEAVPTSNALADLLRQLLCKDPNQRITAAQASQAQQRVHALRRHACLRARGAIVPDRYLIRAPRPRCGVPAAEPLLAILPVAPPVHRSW